MSSTPSPFKSPFASFPKYRVIIFEAEFGAGGMSEIPFSRKTLTPPIKYGPSCVFI